MMEEDVINIINLDPLNEARSLNKDCPPELIIRSREQRALSIIRQSKEQYFPIRFWEGQICRGSFIDGRIGISRAFKKIVRWAKEKQLGRVIIGEDDILFSAPGAWGYYLANIPPSYDIFLGSIYAGDISGNRVVKGYSGHSLIAIHNRSYDFILSADENIHLDRWCGRFCSEKEFIACLPFVVYQIKEGYSDNHNRVVSHEGYLKGVKFFGQD